MFLSKYNTKSFEDVIKKGDKTMGVMSLLFGAILAILPVITLLNPDSTNYTLFGKYTYIYLYIGTITTPLGCFCVMNSQRLKLPMLEYISKAWVSQIKDYLKRIREILLEHNENGGKKERDKTIRLSFRSKGNDIYIGEFLNEDDKKILKDEIKNIIERLNLKNF